MTQTSNADRKVPTRRISFEESLAGLPKHFVADDDLIMSHVVAVLSSVFPDGEDFFVKSVRHHRDQITDPDLKRQVAGFIGQESVHGREHRALNERLAVVGYPTKRIERMTRNGLALRWRFMSPESNLAATAALEHFTATLAELLLGRPDCRAAIGEGPVLDLLTWHALEEAEHKAVAFDVYRAVGGRERTRVLTMRFIRFGFIAGTTFQVALSLLRDREAYRRGRLRASLKRLRTNPFLRKEVLDMLREYDRPGFHPDDRDATELVERWRRELFGEQGTLNDKLVTSVSAA